MGELVITMNDGTQYLAHHGIKGMKWGVRRFQNADGTLTEEGKVRQAKREFRADKRAVRRSAKDVRNKRAAFKQVNKRHNPKDPVTLAWNVNYERFMSSVSTYETVANNFVNKYSQEDLNKLGAGRFLFGNSVTIADREVKKRHKNDI